MSIFAKIKSTKKAADEHKAQAAAKEAALATKPAPTPYHHIPRHAAQDALAGTPGQADREAIREANHARVMYANDSFHSTSSPSLVRSYSSDAVSGHREGSNGSTSLSSRSSRVGLHPRTNRRTHPGYQSYQSFQLPSRQPSQGGSSPRQPKSPLSSEPITPQDGSEASSSASFSSNRSYTDAIEPSAPLSERLEGYPPRAKTTPRTPLYTSRTADQPKPWEVAAARKKAHDDAATEKGPQVSEVELQSPEPAAKVATRSRFMGFKGKQQAVAAC